MPVLTMLLPVFFAFALMSCKLFNSLRTMEIQMGMGVVLSNYESPSLFWFVIAFQCLVIGALLDRLLACFCVSEPDHELKASSSLPQAKSGQRFVGRISALRRAGLIATVCLGGLP